MFLVQILGYEWDEVHAEADRLEHHISEAFEERIAEALGDQTIQVIQSQLVNWRSKSSMMFLCAVSEQGDTPSVQHVRESDPDIAAGGGIWTNPRCPFRGTTIFPTR